MKKFEYQVLEFNQRKLGGFFKTENINLALMKLGNEGWEIVSIIPNRAFLGTTISLIYTFKKEINR